jgi:hydrogenase maturation protease
METARILIAGIGNIFLGDDGFGCEVAERLSRREWPESVRVVDFGIRALDLIYALSDGYDAAILVDAVPRGGEPGTVYLIDPDLSDLNDAVATFVDAHAMDPLKVLSLVRLMGGTIRRVLIVGCEPLTVGPEEGQMGLSDPVAAAVDDAINCIESLVKELLLTDFVGGLKDETRSVESALKESTNMVGETEN